MVICISMPQSTWGVERVYKRVKAQSERTVGTQSTMRAVKRGLVAEVVLARDGDRRVLNPLIALCKQTGVKVNWVDCQDALGQAVGLELPTCTVGFLRKDAVQA